VLADTTPLVQVVIPVASALLLTLLTLVSRLVYNVVNDVHEIKDVLITPKPTQLVPKPPLGLVDQVALLVIDATPPNGDKSSSRAVLERIEAHVDPDPTGPT
jgi:hypothetical protein